jgi:UDP-2,4-diacetamido-2,4,6-trideoxy-beta-L-altropyranose hydrolase
MRKLFLRADGNGMIGWGHLYRLLALAETLKYDFECIFVTHDPGAFFLSEIKRICSGYILLELTFEQKRPDERRQDEEMEFDLGGLISERDIVVTDGYLFGPVYQSKIKETGCFLICITDMTSGKFNSDILINAAPGLDYSGYAVSHRARLYLGLEYMILRPAFFELPLEKRTETKKELYIAFGGSDYHHLSYQALKHSSTVPGIEKIHVVYAESYDEVLKGKLNQLQENDRAKIQLYKNLAAAEIIGILDKCTYAIVSASTVCLEVLSRRIKPLIGHYVQNQVQLYNGIVGEDLAFGMGNVLPGINHLIIENYLKSDPKSEREFSNQKIKNIFTNELFLKKS